MCKFKIQIGRRKHTQRVNWMYYKHIPNTYNYENTQTCVCVWPKLVCVCVVNWKHLFILMVHITDEWHRQHTAAVEQPVDGAHPRVLEALHLAKLLQMEGELPGHGPDRRERGQDLGEQEEEVEGVDGSL